jgi:hypothetical protein
MEQEMLRASTAAWTQLVSCLAGNESQAITTIATRTKVKRYLNARLQSNAVRSASVRILDKPTLRTLIVSWRDALTGHYGYQVWTAQKAKREGFCAITGRHIERGDPVFSPRNGKARPANSAAMIAAECSDRQLLT